MRPKICISDLLSDLKRAGSFYFIPVSDKKYFHTAVQRNYYNIRDNCEKRPYVKTIHELGVLRPWDRVLPIRSRAWRCSTAVAFLP